MGLPYCNSTVGRAFRLVNAGTNVAWNVTALAKSSSLTYGSTRRLITPRDKTVGTKPNSTPNFLNSMDMVGKLLAPPVLEGTGTGNSPPARNRADSPDNAIRFGSAKRRTSPFVSSADTNRSTELPLFSFSTFVRRLPNGTAPLASVPTLPRRGTPDGVLCENG